MKKTLIITASLVIITCLFFIIKPHKIFIPENLYSKSWDLNGDLGTHDPVIIRTSKGWHLFYTGVGIRSKFSKDGITWKDVDSIFSKRHEWYKKYVPYARQSIWAPDILKYKGKYYLFYSISAFGKNDSAIGVSVNKTLDWEDDDYSWKDLGPVIHSKKSDNFNAIDPNAIVAEDGSLWLSFGSFWSGIKLVQLDTKTLKPIDEKMHSLANRGGVNAVEAPYIVYRNDYYYLFLSIDFCCRGSNSTYKTIIGRSKNITGPYYDHNGIDLINGGGKIILNSSKRWKGPGHCAVYISGKSSIIVYHAYDAENNGASTLHIEPLYWDDQNWPYIQN